MRKRMHEEQETCRDPGETPIKRNAKTNVPRMQDTAR